VWAVVRHPVANGSRVISRRRTSRNVALTAAFLALAAGGAAACDASPVDEDDPFSSYVTGPGGPGYSDSGSSGSDGGASGYSGSGSSGSDAGGSDADGGSDGGYSSSGGDEADMSDVGETDEVFYCADEDGQIVDADYCDDDGDGGSSYFIWHSSSYARGLTAGSSLDGGDYFPAGDRKARRAYHLPATGKVSNGTVKTNVVGQRSSGSTSSSGSGSAGG
jgi:hypothetical protein